MRHSSDLDLNGKCCIKLITPRRMKIHCICLFGACLAFSSRYLSLRSMFTGRGDIPNRATELLPKKKSFRKLFFYVSVDFGFLGGSGLLVPSTMAEQGSSFPHPPARHLAGIPGLVPNRLVFHVFTRGKRARPAPVPGASRRSENMALLR